MSVRAQTATLALLLLTFGCERQRVFLFQGSPDNDSGPPILSLSVRPGALELRVNGRPGSGDATLQAFAAEADGEHEVSAQAEWTLSNPDLGEIAGGVFRSSGSVAGSTRVTARLQGMEASANLDIFLDASAVAPGTPANAASFFPEDLGGDDTGPAGPLIVYPSEETLFPLNVSRTLFQWHAPPAEDLFELRFDSSVARIRYYTTDRAWQVDEASRDWIARSHAGRSLTVTVRGLVSTSSAAVRRSHPIHIQYSSAPVPGSLYYWSTGAAAIMRATLDAPAPARFFPGDEDMACASCHSVSRDGRKMVLGYTDERLRVITIPDRQVLYPLSSGPMDRKFGWGSFDPSGERVLVADKGVLAQLELSSGTFSPVPLPAMMAATHPDWSPDGRQIALVVSARPSGNKEVKGTSLARMLVDADGRFAAPQVLLANSDPEDTLAFPSHSPDSQWIAFVKTRGKSKDSVAAELYLIRADGSGPAILLERLNRRVGPDEGVTAIGNSMPTWAPSDQPEISWLAFSSIRDYGDVLNNVDRDQLWAAALDLSRASAGDDPSSPAFWLPFQSLNEGNHRAFWSLNPEDSCPSTLELCDGLDNDCNGQVDDGCCTPQAEICNDGIDNDCDGARDEGCGCSPTESCANSLDDDCDGLIDLADEDCQL